MERIARMLEKLFIDITFAEDRIFNPIGEASKKIAQKMEDAFTAIAFAEEGEFETAASFINKDGEVPKSRRAGHPGIGFTGPCTGRA